MYPQPSTPSRPERPRSEQNSLRRRRVVLWIVAVTAFLAASAYVVGGRELMRRFLQVRSNATAALQPPTPADMQRAVADTGATRETTVVSRVSLPIMAVLIGSILVIVISLFYLTGRPRAKRAHD